MKESFQIFLRGIEKEFCMLGFDFDALNAYTCRVAGEQNIDLKELLCSIENSNVKKSKFAMYFLATSHLCQLCETRWTALELEMNYSVLALKKYPPALYAIGQFYLYGLNSDKDLKKALGYFRLSAEGGFVPGKTQIANLLFRGSREYKIPADRSYAEQLYTETIQAGDTKAAYYYAFSLLDTHCVPLHDKAKAMKLLNQAAANGVQAAKRLLLIDANANKLRRESTPSPVFEIEL